MCNPLHITAHPLAPIITDHLLSIDGPLFFQAMRREYGPQDYTLPGAITAEPVSLPLERRGQGGEWYYAASSAVWEYPCEGASFWTKRFRRTEAERMVDFKGRRGRVVTSEGRFKSYQMPVFYYHALRIHWYVVGDIAAIGELLQGLTHIGKKTAYGWGRVLWAIEPWHSDWSEWGPQGQQMRPLPADDGILYGVRPSYHLPENWAICRVPGRNDAPLVCN